MKTQPIRGIDQRYHDTALAFDSVAAEYDGPLGNNSLVQHMRSVLWQEVEALAAPGTRLLDLGCGTGLDAVHFAQHGYRVTAIDGSAEMTQHTSRRAAGAGLADSLIALHMGIQELPYLADEGLAEPYDLIYSDLGALNCLPELGTLAQRCAGLLKPGGHLVFSVIGRACPWELAYYGTRGHWRRATVRFARGQVPVGLNGHTVWTHYYTPREFYRPFAPWFEWRACRAINLFLPPPYLVRFAERRVSLARLLAWLDDRAGRLPLLNQAGDHFLLVMRRHE